MRHEGRLTEWNDAKGFGFIAPVTGGPRVFVHVSEFPRGRRPAVDDLLVYSEGRDARNRPRATQVQLVASTRSSRGRAPGVMTALAAAGGFLALLGALVVLDRAPAALLIPYVGFSVLELALYRSDKSAAQRGARRVPEANLHLVALLGGWPGALVARRLFRHKTTKQPFRTVFWLTVLVNCMALAWMVVAAG